MFHNIGSKKKKYLLFWKVTLFVVLGRSWKRPPACLFTSIVAGQMRLTKDVLILIPRLCQCRWDLSQDLRMGKSPWVIWLGPVSPQGFPSQGGRRARGEQVRGCEQRRERQCAHKAERGSSEEAVLLALKMKDGPRAKECWQPADSIKDKDWILSWHF